MYELQEPNYYAVLDVDADASAPTIVRAYRQLALRHHPDRNPSAPPERFQQIKEAYEVLSDPEKRRLYDHYGPSLRPQLGEAFTKLAPLLLSLATGFAGAGAHTLGWVRGGWGWSPLATAAALELGVVGLAGLHYCAPSAWDKSASALPSARRRPSGTPRREVVSVADYAAVSCLGLALGNAGGWISASALLLVRALLFGR